MSPWKVWALLGAAVMVTGFMSWAALVFTGQAFERPLVALGALLAMVVGALATVLAGIELLMDWLTR